MSSTTDEQPGEAVSHEEHPGSAVVLARLEQRVRDLEDALERSLGRQRELERRHASTREQLQARFDEALDALTDTQARSRAIADDQQRVQRELAASQRSVQRRLDELRDELTDRISRVRGLLEAAQGELADEVGSFAEEVRGRLAQLDTRLDHAADREERGATLVDDQVEELRGFVIRRLVEASQGVEAQREAVTALTDELKDRSAVVDGHRRRLDRLDEQVAEAGRRVRAIDDAVHGAVQRHRERTAAGGSSTADGPVDDAAAAGAIDEDDTDER